MFSCILLFFVIINSQECTSVLLRGKRVQDGQFPWLIQFQTIAPCGGVLISPDWVLTAAQCVQDQRNSIVLCATGLNGTGSSQAISVKATYFFPGYDAYSANRDRDHNIALVKLTKPFDMCNPKATLPNISPVRFDDNYKLCLIFGWQSYLSPSSKVLAKPIQYSEVILNSWKLCTYMIKGNANYSNVFCTMVETEDEMKACAGNPGSPVICQNQYHKEVLLGIASWTNFSLDCGDLPTYLDVSVFRDWMDDLLFNGKIEEPGIGGNNKAHCILEPNAGNINTTNNERKRSELNNSSTTSVVHQNAQIIVLENSTSSQTENKIHSVDDTRLTSQNNYYNPPYTDKIKPVTDNLRQYQEIGKTKNSRNRDKIMAGSDKYKKMNYLNKSTYPNKYRNKFPTEYEEFESEDADVLEFLYDYNSEDLSISYSPIITRDRNLIFLNLIFLYVIYRIFYL